MENTKTFEDYAKVGKCEVCGEEAPVVVLASPFGGFSSAYCKECYENGLYPYSDMVDSVWCCGWDNMSDSVKEMIRKTLKKLNKTEEEMLKDVQKCEDDFMLAMESLPKDDFMQEV